MNDLVSQVEQSILRHRLLRRGRRILAAVSGGLDSMVLLRVLHELAARHGWRLVIAHFNHQLRGAESDADEALVRRTARRLGWPCVTERGDVRALAREQKLSVEMAARQLRHEFLARAARRRKITTVALAHHAGDQVELFFLRLLRGAGGEGLAGMKRRSLSPADGRVWLARPLLDFDKETLRAFAAREKVSFREDASNASLEFQRNRLRHELLPLLRRNYQPALDRVVLRLMRWLGGTADFAAAEADHWLRAQDWRAFASLPPALQRTVLQRQLHQLGLNADSDLIERLRETARRPVSVGPGCQVLRDARGVVSVRRLAQVSFRDTMLGVDLRREPRAASFDGVALGWKFLSGPKLPARRPGCEFFDAGKVGSGITLRHWRKGDRFQPIGMSGPVKLQDWFTNQKVPRARRHELVLATTAAGEIFWVEGQRIAEAFKVGPATRRRLRWEWKRERGCARQRD